MALGSAFPRGFVEAQIQRQLKPGTVIKMRQVMDDGAVHEKRFVVAAVNEHTVTFVINTAISAFLQARPALLKCQVAMPVADHDFMSHDSHVDCHRTHTYATHEVVRDLVTQPDWVLGSISDDLRIAMLAAVKFSPTLSVKEAARLCESLQKNSS
jgi:hypothetical protein